MERAIQAEGLGKRYRIGSASPAYGRLTEQIAQSIRGLGRARNAAPSKTERELWALRDASFEVSEGEVVGVIGRNGAGKSTLLKILTRITKPTTGSASVHGRVGSLLEVGTGFHPDLSGRENVYLNGAVLGMRRREIEAKFDDIVGFAEVERFIDTPVKRYSSGMTVRLAFAVAAFLEPEILFIDEVLSVGDQAFQKRCIGRMGEIAHSGRTILFVSHDLASVTALCTRAMLVDSGQILRNGAVEGVVQEYLSIVRTHSAKTIEDREDRKGNGRLRILEMDIGSADGGPARTGREALVRLGYRTSAVGSAVSVRTSVEGPLGEPLFVFWTDVSGEELALETSEGEFVCNVPALPLLPGRYSLTFYIEVAGVLADCVRNALYFEVFEDDVFGTGRLPPASFGHVYVNHSWTISSNGSGATP